MRIRLGGQLVSLPASLDRTKLNPWFMNRAVVAMMVARGGGGERQHSQHYGGTEEDSGVR